PTALESLVSGQVVACWLELAHAQHQGAEGGNAFHLKRAESAQRRFLAASKTLAALRALLPGGLAPASPLCLHAPRQGKQLGCPLQGVALAVLLRAGAGGAGGHRSAQR